MRCRLLLVLLVLAWWAAETQPAVAHAILERSSPSPSATHDLPPTQVVLVLTERVDSRFTSVIVIDTHGQHVSGQASSSADRRIVTVPLRDVTRGIYTVRWRVLSTVDGHITSGVFAFGVGQPVTSEARVTQAAPPDPVRIGARWLGLIAAILLAGSVFFRPLVLRPALDAMPAGEAQAVRAAAEGRLRTLGVFASACLLSSLVADLVLQAVLLNASSPAVSGSVLWELLRGTRTGWSVLLRAAVAVFLVASDPSRSWSMRLAPLAAAGLLAGFTMTAHASGQGPLAVAADWLHLLAVAAWIGGLATLLLVLQGTVPSLRRSLARALVPRFSNLAAIGLGIVVITGLYSAWLHVPALRALVVTAYGRALQIKLVLVAVVVLVGAMNRFMMRPRLAASAPHEGLVQRFMRLASGEVGVGAAVLLVVAVLTISPPATVTFSAGAPQAVILVGYAGDARVRLSVDPARPGWNRYEAVAMGADRRSLDSEARLLLLFMKLEEDLNPTTVVLTPTGDGRYAAEGGELALPGWWEVEVAVRRRGRPDASTFFPLRLGKPLPPRTDASAQQLLEDARDVPLRTWREVEQVTDGNGSVVTTHYALAPPDRLQYLSRYELEPTQTTGITEVVVIGADRYERKDAGSWRRETLQRPLIAEGHLVYMRVAEGIGSGRQGLCDDEPCQVVLWTNPGGSPAFAAWIGRKSLRVHRLYMLSPSHYMTVRPFDLGAPVRIEPPRE